MRLIILCCCLTLLLPLQHAAAADLQEIELTDGGSVIAEVLSLTDGIYTVRSSTLGILKIKASRIRAIHRQSTPGQAGTERSAGSATVEMETLQGKMLSNPDIMALIQSLQNDPEFQKILEDPEIMKAVNTGDASALAANPRFLKLLNNKTVKDIQNRVK